MPNCKIRLPLSRLELDFVVLSLSLTLSNGVMAGGGVAPLGVAKERVDQYKGRATAFVLTACFVAAVGGAIFGYDIGISGTGFSLLSSFFLQKRTL